MDRHADTHGEAPELPLRERHCTAQGLDPFFNSDETQAEWGFWLHSFPVILDPNVHDLTCTRWLSGASVRRRGRNPHRGTAGLGMAGHVRQAFLHDPVDRDAQRVIQLLRQSGCLDRPFGLALPGSPGFDQIMQRLIQAQLIETLRP